MNMILASLGLGLFLLTSFSASAATVSDCVGLDSIGMLIGSTKAFANGAVKLAYVSTEEPAASPDHLLVFVYGEEMSVTCASINAGPEKAGFGSIDFEKAKGTYSASEGLTLHVLASTWTGVDGVYAKEQLEIVVDRRKAHPVITVR